jgi:hypothetical protein
LFGDPQVVNLGDYKWPQRPKKVRPSPKNFVLTAFYVNFDELRYRSSVSDEIVKGNRFHTYCVAATQNGMLAVDFYSTM